jgi:RNA polymerase sigma factor (sigma-70 family)
MEPKELQDLLERIHQGSQQAAKSLVVVFNDTVQRVVRSRFNPLLDSRVTWQEIVQDVWSDFFVKVVPGESCPAAAALRAYLIRLASNKVCDAHREHLAAKKRSRDRECPLPPEVQERGPSREQNVDFRDDLDRDLQKLSKQERETVILRLEGATLAQVAAVLGIDVRTVRNILDRIVQRHALRALEGLRGGGHAEQGPEKL